MNATLQFGPSNFTIRSIAAYDRTLYGNGGWLNLSGGLNQTHLTLDFKSEEIGLGIDYSVVIFGVSTIGANHFIRRNFYNGDVLLYSLVLDSSMYFVFIDYEFGIFNFYREHFLVAADPDTIVFGTVEYNATGNQYIYLVQGIDQATDGNGGILNMIVGVSLGFQSASNNLGIDFIINIYGS